MTVLVFWKSAETTQHIQTYNALYKYTSATVHNANIQDKKVREFIVLQQTSYIYMSIHGVLIQLILYMHTK